MSNPRIMIAAPSSGCGKTTFTCALLRAFIRRGQQCAAFKCGPDYIDPMFHRACVGACRFIFLRGTSPPANFNPGKPEYGFVHFRRGYGVL